jgi:hypothetical protein
MWRVSISTLLILLLMVYPHRIRMGSSSSIDLSKIVRVDGTPTASSLLPLISHYAPSNDPETGKPWDCQRPWPSVELILPVYLKEGNKRNDEFLKFFMRSFLLFWPVKESKVKLRVMFDVELRGSALVNTTIQSLQYLVGNYTASMEEKASTGEGVAVTSATSHLSHKHHHQHKQKLHHLHQNNDGQQPTAAAITTSTSASLPGYITIDYIPQSVYYQTGYDRQQWFMFWADNFTTSEYVGFVDCDCLFTSYVDREDLFENGKPAINGRIGVNKRPPWSGVPARTQAFTGYLEPMRCMTYFPVILKTAHMKEIRDFIGQKHVRFHGLSYIIYRLREGASEDCGLWRLIFRVEGRAKKHRVDGLFAQPGEESDVAICWFQLILLGDSRELGLVCRWWCHTPLPMLSNDVITIGKPTQAPGCPREG